LAVLKIVDETKNKSRDSGVPTYFIKSQTHPNLLCKFEVAHRREEISEQSKAGTLLRTCFFIGLIG
jgi:hypothetical protein